MITGLAWSVLGVMLKIALQKTDAASISWIRFVISSLVLFLWFLFMNPQKIMAIRKIPWTIFIAGLGLAGNYLGFVKGVGLTTAGNATIISQLGPLLLALFGIFYFNEKINSRKLISILIATTGFIFFYFDQLKLSGDMLSFISGNQWLIFGSFTWALWGLIQKKLSLQGWHPQQLNMCVFAISACALLPFAKPASLLSLDFNTWVLLVMLALNTLIGYGCLALAMNHAPMNQVSLIISCYPLLTLVLIQLLDQAHLTELRPEPLGWFGVIGALLVVSGVVLSVKKA